ncbi:hypothetical protein CRE_03322 [Caenorhabditis remanei]|uniref:Uncharacterized protein n=1 Tax=Caenorhabditis remanei TaxID=31234 RepID=E3MYL2_CAERE|nr:hypothetical protein CRE_03322 [Caenorhabditis remanei]
MSSDDEEYFAMLLREQAARNDAQKSSTSQAETKKEQTETTDSQLSNSIKSLLETVEEVRSDLIELENKHGDAATVLFSQIIEKLGSLWNTAFSLDKKYKNTEHWKLVQEVFQRVSSVKLVLHDLLKPGSSLYCPEITKGLHEIYELRMLLSQHSGTSDTSRSPESTRYLAVFQKAPEIFSSVIPIDSSRKPDEIRSIPFEYRGHSRQSYDSSRGLDEIFFEPQVARINLNQDLDDQVSNLKNEVNNLLVDCTAAEDTMKSCLTTISQNSRKLDEMENKVSSMNDKQKTATQEAIMSELSHQIRTARLKQNELKNQLASPGFDHREVFGSSIYSRRQELIVHQPTIHSLSVLHAVLEIHCDNAIAICKREYKLAKVRDQNQNEGELGASILHHFLRIEANVLKFQRITAMRWIGKGILEKKEQKTRIISDRVVQFHRGGLLTDLNKICTELKTLRDELNNKLSLRRMSFLYFSFENHNQELLLSGSAYSICDIEELLGIPDFVLDVLMDLEDNPNTLSDSLYRPRIDNFLEVFNRMYFESFK